MIYIKSKTEIEKMRDAGRIVAIVLEKLKTCVEPGISTLELDAISEKTCREHGAKPAFKGYSGFPGSICASINEEVIHGIPSKTRILKPGDIIGIDFGVEYKGFFGDSAITLPVGEISDENKKLLEVTNASLFKGIEQARAGNYLFDIGLSVQKYVESFNYSVIREFVGHGIGSSLHEDPQVPNWYPGHKGILLKPGMTLAIEPMVSAGKYDIKVLKDGWTAVTKDGSMSAHFEHTVLITEDGPEILTVVS